MGIFAGTYKTTMKNKGYIGHEENAAERKLTCEARYQYKLVKQKGYLWWREKKAKLIKRRKNIDNLIIKMEKLRQQELNKK